MKISTSTISSVVVRLSLVAVSGMTLSFGQTAMANLITWQTPVAVDINNATQVDTTGTLIFAVSDQAAYSVNGVNFSPALFNALVSNLSGGVSDGAFGPYTTDYAKLLSSGAYRSSDGTANIAIPSLTIGNQYEVQIFTPFWDANYQSKFSDGANSANMGNTSTAPTYVIGTFTADATTKNISFDAASGSPYGLLSAFQVRAIPEPGSFGLLMMGTLGVVAVVRRHRRNSTMKSTCSEA